MRPGPLSKLRRGALAAASLSVAACVVSPQPEPPVTDVPEIQLDLLALDEIDTGAGEAKLVLAGRAGAVTPGSSALRLLDLGVALPETVVDTDADGAFTTTVEALVGHTYRLQAFAGTQRSEPFDVSYVNGFTGSGLAEVQPPLGDCLELDPALEVGPLEAGTSAELTLTNRCSEEVAVSGFPLLLGSPAWTLAPAGAATVPAGEERSFTVTFVPSPGDPTDDMLFVELAAPQAGRRPLTLRGKAP